MAGITLAQAQAQLDSALAALLKAREAQSYSISSGNGARSSDRAQLDELESSARHWEMRVNQLSRGSRIRASGIIPHD